MLYLHLGVAIVEAEPNSLLICFPAMNQLLLHHSAAYTTEDITGKLGPVLDYIVFLPLVIHIHYQEGSLPAYDGGMVVLHKPFGHLPVVYLPFLVQEIYIDKKDFIHKASLRL